MLDSNHPHLLDGAIGSMIEQTFPIESNTKKWSSFLNNNNTHSEKLIEIYMNYISKGSNIITTNTFRTNPYMNKDWEVECEKAIEISKEVQERQERQGNQGKKVLIAGSNPPIEDCYQSRTIIDYEIIRNNHINHINKLKNNVDFILNETISHMDEVFIIENICETNNIKYGISFYFNNDLKLLDGTDILNALRYIDSKVTSNKLFIGVNCVGSSLFDRLLLLIEDQGVVFKHKFSFYLNAYEEKTNVNYDSIRKGLCIFKRVFMIGGCCGTGYDYIDKLKSILDDYDLKG